MAYGKNIRELTPRHYKILDYAVKGTPNKEIAERLSMSQVQVGVIISSPSFQHQFALRRKEYETTLDEHSACEVDEVKNVLKESALKAAQKLIDGIDSKSERTGIKCATEILDRTGYPKETKVGGDTVATQIIINSKDFANLKESLKLDAITVEKIEPASLTTTTE